MYHTHRFNYYVNNKLGKFGRQHDDVRLVNTWRQLSSEKNRKCSTDKNKGALRLSLFRTTSLRVTTKVFSFKPE